MTCEKQLCHAVSEKFNNLADVFLLSCGPAIAPFASKLAMLRE
jgi:hypothetical protein